MPQTWMAITDTGRVLALRSTRERDAWAEARALAAELSETVIEVYRDDHGR